MALKEAQRIFAGLLAKGAFQAEFRPDMTSKNWLAVGKLSADDVIQIIQACKEARYRTYKHLDDPRTIVHDFRSRWREQRWVVKCYLTEGSAMFISAHPAH